MSEQQPYTVVRAFPGCDVRRYPDSVQVHVRACGHILPDGPV